MEKQPVRFQKIPLEGFIDLLMELYQRGANYVDILGIPDEVQDVVSVVVRDEYLAEDNTFDDIVSFTIDMTDDEELSDNDFNNLII